MSTEEHPLAILKGKLMSLKPASLGAALIAAHQALASKFSTLNLDWMTGSHTVMHNPKNNRRTKPKVKRKK